MKSRTTALGVVDVDAGEGLRLHVVVNGPKSTPAIVLLHGFTGSVETWRPLLKTLRTDFRAAALDLPGHGRSSAPADSRRYALDRFADDLARVLDAIGASRAVLLGYSMGGRAALRFALRHPERLAALILESTSPGIEDAAEREARRRSDQELAELLERDGIESFVDRWERLPLWASQAKLSENARAELRASRLAQSPMGLSRSLLGAGAGEAESVLDRLAEIRVPVLLIAGALDATYVDHARRMASRIPKAMVKVVPGAGHAVHLERPAEYATLVKSFAAQNTFMRRDATHQENA